MYYFWLRLTSHRQIIGHMVTSNFHCGDRPHVALHTLFQTRAGTWVEPATFRKLAGYLPHMKEFAPFGIRTHSSEGQVVRSQRRSPLGHGRPLYVFVTHKNILTYI